MPRKMFFQGIDTSVYDFNTDTNRNKIIYCRIFWRGIPPKMFVTPVDYFLSLACKPHIRSYICLDVKWKKFLKYDDRQRPIP